MSEPVIDRRLEPATWDGSDPGQAHRRRAAALAIVSTVALLLYFWWLLRPDRIGNPVLFGVLIVAELFNVTQALGFWWTCLGRRARPGLAGPFHAIDVDVDVFIPTYSEPVDVVEVTVAAATRIRGARVHVALLDDGNRDEMQHLAERYGVRYIRRTLHQGAKAGNINHALGRTRSPYVLVLDCDHVPHQDMLIRTMPEFADDVGGEAPAEPTPCDSAFVSDAEPAEQAKREPDAARGSTIPLKSRVAYVQTPQYYANAGDSRIAGASWSQQALFFGPIARGKDAHDAMFCCGTNVIFRRQALEEVGGFPTGSLTEDFALSVGLHERRWRSAYVPAVLASGLGPEDLASYVSQQHRWARGCIGMIPGVLRAKLPVAKKLQYLLSASYFLTGWTVLVYLTMPVVRILTGAQPLAGAAADSFLAAFGPYFLLSLATVASVGAGKYTFAAYSLATSTFWIHVHATWRVVARRTGSFVVTPKQGQSGRQLRPALPTLVAIAVLVGAAVYGLAHGRDAATLNNVAFAALHIAILGHGVSAAVAPRLAGAVPARQTRSELAA